jgi:hypothetical protein
LLSAALFCLVVNAVLTVSYFFPRNEVLFVADLSSALVSIREACGQWSQMNWLRSVLMLLALVFQFLALDRFAFRRTDS